MNISAELENDLLEVIVSKLQLGADTDISIRSISVDEAELTLRIEVLVETARSPKSVADGYFGLTRAVREKLGDPWRDFFPVIAPSIRERHA